jgi:cytochrome c556
MNENTDQLRSAFMAHEALAPDPGPVYARAQELARKYRRRRLGVQAAGGAVLGAGLIAGGLALPGHGSRQPVVVQAAGQSGATTPPSPAELQKDLDAYFAAGYDYNNAVKLAAIWHIKIPADRNLDPVKAEAGRRLLAGQTLPVKPNVKITPVDPKVQAEVDAFFHAGYTVDDAVALAKLWKDKTPYDAKVEGGTKLLAGEKLPIKPGSSPSSGNQDDAQLAAFFNAGYTYADAVKLAKMWKDKKVYDAKVDAGRRLLAGQVLPIPPSGEKPTPGGDDAEAKDLNAFFSAGYDYKDAVRLAKIWKSKTAYDAKVEGGKRLLAGQTLPFAP